MEVPLRGFSELFIDFQGCGPLKEKFKELAYFSVGRSVIS